MNRQVSATRQTRIGVDWGGTKIEILALGGNGEEILRKRVSTPRHDYAGSIRVVVELLRSIEMEIGEKCSVGVGIPGMIDPCSGLVRNANSTWLNGKPLERDLSGALDRPVRCINDANCLAVSEASDGAGAGKQLVFAAILGTGCGAGIAIAGKVHSSQNGLGGEWGHNPLPWQTAQEYPGKECYCGQRGCIELWISGRGFEEDYRQHSGNRSSGEGIMQLHASCDPAAQACLERYEDRLARSLAHVVNLLDPDVIVLGGGMSRIDHLYTAVPPLMQKYIFGKECTTPIYRAKHGDSSGVRGAAWLWPLED